MLDVIENFRCFTYVRSVNTAVPYDPLSSRTSWLLLVDARTLRTIRPAVLMLTVDRSKAIQLWDRVIPNGLRAFPPIRRTHLAMLTLYRPASAPPTTYEVSQVTHAELECLNETQGLIG